MWHFQMLIRVFIPRREKMCSFHWLISFFSKDESTRVKLPMRNNDQLSSYINANYIYGFQKENNEGEEENVFRNSNVITSTSINPSTQSSLSYSSSFSHHNPPHHSHFYTNHRKSPPAYIASQGPMSNTINDFWLMIWNESVSCVVMITKLIERSKSKCELYLPKQDSETVAYDQIVVTVKKVNYFQDYEVRHLEVQVCKKKKFFEVQTLINALWFFSSVTMKLELFITIGIQRGKITICPIIQTLSYSL